MQDIIFVHILYPLANLLDILTNNFLRKPSNLLQILIKISAEARLKDQVSCLLIDKKVIEVHYMRMVQKALDLYLSDELLQGVFVDY